MNIEELVVALKEKGLGEEEIKAELEKIKADIDKYLGVAQPEQKEEIEQEDAKMKEVFGD